ncbi:ankyrin [Neocallimastix lanati (nom. inval.)]|nr:ankyrin [Neocallimastix sp. JGI-2020a]
MILYQYKYKRSTSVTNLNRIMSNDQYIISTYYSTENFQDYFFGDTPLCCAYRIGDEKLKGADVNKEDNYKDTPLCRACRMANVKVVKCLIEHGADVNKVEFFNKTSLYCACARGNEKIAKYLIEHGANIKIADRKDYSNLCIMACLCGNENL